MGPKCQDDVYGLCKKKFGGYGVCIDTRFDDLNNINFTVLPEKGLCGVEDEDCCLCFMANGLSPVPVLNIDTKHGLAPVKDFDTKYGTNYDSNDTNYDSNDDSNYDSDYDSDSDSYDYNL